MEFASILENAWVAHLEETKQKKSGKPMEREYVWATGRRDCVRWMALDLLAPEDYGKWPAATLERFKQGDEMEHATRATLMQIGPFAEVPFEIIRSQERFEIRDRDGVLLIVGKVDGVIEFKNTDKKIQAVYEVKSGDLMRNVSCFDDLERNRYTNHYADQLLAYMLGQSIPYGILICRAPGKIPVPIVFHLEDHLERAEQFLIEAREAVDAKRSNAATLPAYTEDTSLCFHCPHFGKTCVPPKISYGRGADVIDDPEWQSDVEEQLDLQDKAKRYDELRAINRQRMLMLMGDMKHSGMKIIGDAVAHVKVVHRKANPTPAPRPARKELRIRYERLGGTDGTQTRQQDGAQKA